MTPQDAEASALGATPYGALKTLWGLVATALALLYTAVLVPTAAVCAPFAEGRIVRRIGRLWGWLIIRTCGIKVEIEGSENFAGLDAFVLVANHQSFFDIFAILAFLPREVRFVAKKELLRIPVFGFALKRSGHIIVDRQHGGQTVRKALEAARRGFCICFFAEGHRYSDNQVHPFNEGAAWLAIQTRLPCVPMAISGTTAFFPRGARVVVPGGRMRLKFGPPLATAHLSSKERAALTRQLEAAVRANFSVAL